MSCEIHAHNRSLFSIIENNRLTILRDYDTFLKSRKDLLSDYMIDNFGTDKKNNIHRRSIWGTIGNFLYSSILAGLSEYQILQLKKHLQNTKAEVNNLAISVHNLKKGQINFEEKTAALIKNIEYLRERDASQWDCKIEFASYVQNMKMNLNSYKITLDNILWPAISGYGTVVLNPNILDPATLKKITNEHIAFKNLIFREKPMYLYSVSNITLVEVDDNLSVVKLVLTFPRIEEKFIFPLYYTNQVGNYLGGGFCKYFEITEHSFDINGTLYPIHLDDCTRHAFLYVCKRHENPHKESCLQFKKFQCTAKKTICKGEFDYIQLDNGILFRNNKDTHFIRNFENKISIPQINGGRVGFVNWTKNKDFQIGDMKIENPTIMMTPITIQNYSTPLKFNFSENNIDEDIFKLIKQFKYDIHNEVNDSFHEKLHKVQNKHKIALIVGLTVISIFIIWLILVSIFIYIYFKRYITFKKILQDPTTLLNPQEGSEEEISIKSSRF